MMAYQGETTMYDFEDVNAVLAQLAANDAVEPMVEPIDEPTCHPMDWAEVTGLADELADDIYPETNLA
jgi:hypothetical protein